MRRDPLWIEQETVEIRDEALLLRLGRAWRKRGVLDRIVGGLLWLTLFGMGAGLLAVMVMGAMEFRNGNAPIPWTAVAIVGACVAFLFLPEHWTDYLASVAIKCILWIALAVVGLVVLALALWGISTINFNAPLTLGGGIVIGMIVILAVSSQRT
jgi:hypothetical protein